MKQLEYSFVQNLGLWILLVLGLAAIMATCFIVLWNDTASGMFFSFLCLLPLFHTIRSVHRDRYIHDYDARKYLFRQCEIEEEKKR